MECCALKSTGYPSPGKHTEGMASDHLIPASKSVSIIAGKFARNCPACSHIAAQSRYKSHIFYLYPDQPPALEKDKCSVVRSIRSKDRISTTLTSSSATASKTWLSKTIARLYESVLAKCLRIGLGRLFSWKRWV